MSVALEVDILPKIKIEIKVPKKKKMWNNAFFSRLPH